LRSILNARFATTSFTATAATAFCSTRTTSAFSTIQNNIITSNGGYGIKFLVAPVTTISQQIDYNAYYNNTSGPVNNLTQSTHDVTADRRSIHARPATTSRSTRHQAAERLAARLASPAYSPAG
jgi:hypothetical protein